MKAMNRILLLPIILILFQPCMGLAQNISTRDIIQRAMKDEMKRNMDRLKLENMNRPFFISYNIFDVNALEVNASLGSIVSSNEIRNRNHNVRVIVGDYSLNNENFEDRVYRYRDTMLQGSDRLPLEDNYDDIRRALWIATDNAYKQVVEKYESKKAALKKQTISDEDAQIDDFSRTQVVSYTESPRTVALDVKKWKKISEELSGIFLAYPQIYSSYVRVYLFHSDNFITNSEGTEVVKPFTLAAIQVNAYSQAVDGEPLSNHVMFYSSIPDDLPSTKVIEQSIKAMAEELVALCNAPIFDESYLGPVMLEGQAVAEFFSQRLFTGKNGLLAYRRPVVSGSGGLSMSSSDVETLDDRINRRIMSIDFTIKAFPNLKKFMDQNLIGSYDIDEEGVKPPSEIVLVENGILKTLLTNRIPNPKVKESNGHQRPVIGSAYSSSSNLGPSVITMSTSNAKSETDLKKELINCARNEGMNYGILIKKLKPTVCGDPFYDPMVQMTATASMSDETTLSEPILIYRVYVEDGREELVRSVKLGKVSNSTLRHISSASKQQYIYNILSRSGWNSGIPASFIVPQTLILEELEITKEKRVYTPKLPSVSSPLR